MLTRCCLSIDAQIANYRQVEFPAMEKSPGNLSLSACR